MNDERLETESQRQAADWVRGLSEDETPSLLWRSNLNEAIRAEVAQRARKRRGWLVARPVLGLAMASALAFVVFFPRPNPPAPKTGHLEANLVAMYEDSVRTADIVGSGLRPNEAPANLLPDSDPLIDLDAGAL